MSGEEAAAATQFVDWDQLRTAAKDASQHAYAPYSAFPVGAAALVDDGRVVTGCNVENASYGLGLCAECGLVSALQASGVGRWRLPVAGRVCSSCGHVGALWEHGVVMSGRYAPASAEGAR